MIKTKNKEIENNKNFLGNRCHDLALLVLYSWKFIFPLTLFSVTFCLIPSIELVLKCFRCTDLLQKICLCNYCNNHIAICNFSDGGLKVTCWGVCSQKRFKRSQTDCKKHQRFVWTKETLLDACVILKTLLTGSPCEYSYSGGIPTHLENVKMGSYSAKRLCDLL